MKKHAVSRRFLKIILSTLGVLALIVGLCLIDAFYIEPYFPRVIKQDIPIENLPRSLDGLKIIQLSDLHIAILGKREARALRLINTIEPDLILLTGDYVEDGGITPGDSTRKSCIKEATEFVSQLKAKYGVYAILGNWDSPDMIPIFERSGVHVLENKSITLSIRHAAIRLHGVSAWHSKHEETIASNSPDLPTIVLTHFPYNADDLVKANPEIDLILAGHWHGGQVGWPLRMSDVKYLSGLYKIKNTLLYVNRGLGMHTEAIRFNCPSEITLLTLRAK